MKTLLCQGSGVGSGAWIGAGLILAVTLALIGPADQARAQDPSLGVATSADQLLADRFAQLAVYSLARPDGSPPRADQITCARYLMDLALDSAPDDAELWRFRKELAELEADDRAAEAALKRYIRLRPDDDAAQLDLVLMRLGRLHTVDDRLALLEKILDSRSAASLSEPLRSRLATYAAISAQALGDDERFARYVTRAYRLDASNETAASLALDLVAERGATPAQVGAMTVGLVRASPLSGPVRLQLAEQLTQQAAYKQAGPQYELAARLSGQPLPPESYTGWMISLAAAGQADKARDLADDLQKFMSRRAAEAGAAETEAAVETSDPDTIQTVPLPDDLAVLRLALTDDDAAPAAYDVWRQGQVALAGASEGQAAAGVMGRLAQTAALLGHDLDRVPGYLEQADPQSLAAVRARGWLALRQGDRAQAAAVFGARPTDALCALGLAELADTDASGNGHALLEVIHRHPRSLAAVLAAGKLRDARRSVTPTPGGRSLLKLIDQQPNDLWRMDLKRKPWMDVRLEVRPMRFAFREPVVAQLTVRNGGHLPLSLGDDRTVPATAMVNLSPTVTGQAVMIPPQVIVDVGRRIRLEPGQSVTVPVRLDRSTLGHLLDMSPFRPIAFGTSVTLDPRSGPGGALRPGPLGDTARVRVNQVWGVPVTAENVELWQAQAAGHDPVARLQGLGLLAQAGSGKPGAMTPGTASDPLLGAIADDLNERFKTMDPATQAWVVLMLSAGDTDTSPTEPILEMARRSDDPAVRIAYLVAQVDDSEDPAIDAAMRHADRTLRGFASAYQTLMATNTQERVAAEAEAKNESAAPGRSPGSSPGNFPRATEQR